MKVRIGSNRNAGKGCATFFFLIFFIIGVVASFFIGLWILDVADTYSWVETPASIEYARVERNFTGKDNENPYKPFARYRYNFEGQSYVSETLTTEVPEFRVYDDAYKKIKNFVGESTCFVNPKEPAQAILWRQSLWVALFILIPLLFLSIGGGGIYFSWTAKGDDSENEVKSIARGLESKSKISSQKILFVMGLLFSAIGVIVFWALVGDLIKQYESQSWQKTEAEVIASAIIRNESTDDDGNTSYSFEPDIFYKYSMDGQEHKASRYRFIDTSFSRRSEARKVTENKGVGKLITVYVNPLDSDEAVIDNSISAFAFLYAIPLLFALIGFYLLYLSSKPVKKEQPTISNFQPNTGRTTLEPGISATGKLLGMLFFATFWNGIVSVFLYQAYQGWLNGSPDYFLIVFLIPFVLIGIVTIFGVFYCFLALFNPKTSITISSTELTPGQNLELEWQVKGRAKIISELSVTLEGKEEARYRKGTDTYTEKNIFARLEITKQTLTPSISSGSTSFLLPEDCIHSFDGGNNKITWKLKVHGDIKMWPDINDEYSITVS